MPYLPFWVYLQPFGGYNVGVFRRCACQTLGVPGTTSAKALEPCSMFSRGGAALYCFTEINSVGGSALNSNSGSFGPYLP